MEGGGGPTLHCGSVGESEDVIRLGQCLRRLLGISMVQRIKVTFVHRRNSHFTVAECSTERNRVGWWGVS